MEPNKNVFFNPQIIDALISPAIVKYAADTIIHMMSIYDPQFETDYTLADALNDIMAEGYVPDKEQIKAKLNVFQEEILSQRSSTSKAKQQEFITKHADFFYKLGTGQMDLIPIEARLRSFIEDGSYEQFNWSTIGG